MTEMNEISELNDILEDPQPQARRGGLSLGSVVLLLGVVLAALVFGLQLTRQNQGQPLSGPAPDFTLTTLDGQEVTLSELSGKIVVVNFWASWCGPCRDEAPALEAVWQKYQDRGVMLVGVAYTDTERGAKAFIAEYNQTYPNGLDLGTRISKDLYRITGVPETFVIDHEGNVVQYWLYPVSESILSATLEQLLAKMT